MQDIYLAGEYHPSVASDLADALSQNYTPAQYPPPRLREVGYRCGCLDFFTDPCRLEFRRVSAYMHLACTFFPSWQWGMCMHHLCVRGRFDSHCLGPGALCAHAPQNLWS